MCGCVRDALLHNDSEPLVDNPHCGRSCSRGRNPYGIQEDMDVLGRDGNVSRNLYNTVCNNMTKEEKKEVMDSVEMQVRREQHPFLLCGKKREL